MSGILAAQCWLVVSDCVSLTLWFYIVWRKGRKAWGSHPQLSILWWPDNTPGNVRSLSLPLFHLTLKIFPFYSHSILKKWCVCCVCVCTAVHVWRSDEGLEHQASRVLSSWAGVSLLLAALHNRIDGCELPRILCSLPPMCLPPREAQDCRWVLLHPVFLWLDIRTEDLLLAWQTFHTWSHLPSPEGVLYGLTIAQL